MIGSLSNQQKTDLLRRFDAFRTNEIKVMHQRDQLKLFLSHLKNHMKQLHGNITSVFSREKDIPQKINSTVELKLTKKIVREIMNASSLDSKALMMKLRTFLIT